MVLGWKNLMLSFLKVLWAKFKSTSFMWEEMVHDNKLTHSPGFSVGKWLFTLTRRKRIHSYITLQLFFFLHYINSLILILIVHLDVNISL